MHTDYRGLRWLKFQAILREFSGRLSNQEDYNDTIIPMFEELIQIYQESEGVSTVETYDTLH